MIPRLVLVALLALCVAGCRAPRNVIGRGAYFTQYTLQCEQNSARSTNYRRGEVLPINTRVTILSVGATRAVVRLDDERRELTFEHLPEHTHDTFDEAFTKVFGRDPVDVTGFSAAEQRAIQQGRALVGMDKRAVLAAMGPPPASGTASLELPAWRYWETRWNTFYVRFGEDGRVIDARGR